MKRIIWFLCAVAFLAILAGCVTSDTGMGGVNRPSIPNYHALTRAFDTSARLSVYGVKDYQRDGLIQVLRRAGYTDADAVAPDAAGPIVMPDRIVDIVSADEYAQAGIWQTCHLTVRVRKPMKTMPGGGPVVDVGKTFEVWAHSFAEACANLMNVEAFRLALEVNR